MKKLMILAALGTAALFTACGDDSSSGAPAEGCSVSSTDNSVTVVTSLAGYSATTTYTLTETGYTIKSEADGMEPQVTEVPTQVTIDDLKKMGDDTCKMMDEAETVPAE